MKSSRNKLIGLVILLLFLLPLGLAMKKVDQEVRQEVWNHALIAAIKKNNAAEVTDLLSEGADPNAKDIPPDTRPLWRRLWDRLQGKHVTIDHAHTALVVALAMNDTPTFFPPENVPLIKALLDKGATTNIADEDGLTPLIWAMIDEKRETVRLLLERGANVNAQNNKGDAALHYATADGNSLLVKLLLTYGARVDVKDHLGITPIWMATYTRETESVRLLLASGALVNTRDNQGRSPLQVAKGNKDTEIITMLKKAGAKE